MEGPLELIVVDLYQVLLTHILTLDVWHSYSLPTRLHREILNLLKLNWFLALGMDLEVVRVELMVLIQALEI